MTLNLNDDVFKHLAKIPCRIAGLQETYNLQYNLQLILVIHRSVFANSPTG